MGNLLFRERRSWNPLSSLFKTKPAKFRNNPCVVRDIPGDHTSDHLSDQASDQPGDQVSIVLNQAGSGQFWQRGPEGQNNQF